MGKSRGTVFDRLRTILLILGVLIVLGILGYAFSSGDGYTWQEGELLTPDKLNMLALEPPVCDGENEALQYNGTDWKCVSIEGGGEGDISLGDWEEKSFNTLYNAESDGIVVAYVRPPVSDDVTYMSGYCGPTGSGIPEIRARVYAARGDPIQQASITMPVKSGDKWKVHVSDKDGRNPPYDVKPERSRVWWIPFGSASSGPIAYDVDKPDGTPGNCTGECVDQAPGTVDPATAVCTDAQLWGSPPTSTTCNDHETPALNCSCEGDPI